MVEPNKKWLNRARLVSPKIEKAIEKTTVSVNFSDPLKVSEYYGNRKQTVTEVLKGQYEQITSPMNKNS